MRHLKSCAFLILFVVLSVSLVCQPLENFDDVLSAQKNGKTFTKKVKHDISEQTFLGSVHDNKGNIKYYVVKEFLRVKAAIVYHGHSSILFFSPQKKIVAKTILSMPYELPFKLKNNCLYFTYLENGVKKKFIANIDSLSKMLCVAPKSCYDISSP